MTNWQKTVLCLCAIFLFFVIWDQRKDIESLRAQLDHEIQIRGIETNLLKTDLDRHGHDIEKLLEKKP